MLLARPPRALRLLATAAALAAPLTGCGAPRGAASPSTASALAPGEGMLAVAISDVAPDGTVSRLTGGWQVISHRALDRTIRSLTCE